MEGTVFDIQHYCIHDGPGIRTVVFLKGCPLRCIWCCNPESQRFEPESELRENGEWHKIGREMTAGEVVEEVLCDRNYYRRSGGGVTVSGGEPLAQPVFTKEIVQKCYENNIHTALETTGYADWSIFEELMPYTDLFLYDLKHMDSGIHRKLTGIPNEKILFNLRKLAEAECSIVLRIPFVLEYNGTSENLGRLAEFANQTGIRKINLMPFHQLGKDKYKRLGREYKLEQMEPLQKSREGNERLEQAKRQLEDAGLHVQIGG